MAKLDARKIEVKNYGKLTIVAVVEPTAKSNQFRVMVECNCNTTYPFEVDLHSLKTGNTKSCGCIKGKHRIKHGQSTMGQRSLAYVSWIAMNNRCNNPNYLHYKNYGGRGITICERWKDFNNFWLIWENCSAYHYLERIDNEGNYEPTNCKWATRQEQMLNTRRSVKNKGQN